MWYRVNPLAATPPRPVSILRPDGRPLACPTLGSTIGGTNHTLNNADTGAARRVCPRQADAARSHEVSEAALGDLQDREAASGQADLIPVADLARGDGDEPCGDQRGAGQVGPDLAMTEGDRLVLGGPRGGA